MMIFDPDNPDVLFTVGKMIYVVMALALIMWHFWPGEGGDDDY